jgi:hypothetical protein
MDYFVVMALTASPLFSILFMAIHYFDVCLLISLEELTGLAPRHPHRRRCLPLASPYLTHHHLTLACSVINAFASF